MTKQNIIAGIGVLTLLMGLGSPAFASENSSKTNENKSIPEEIINNNGSFIDINLTTGDVTDESGQLIGTIDLDEFSS